MRKPFFRSQTQSWYVKDADGNFHRLADSEEEAYRIWEKMRELENYSHRDATVEAVCSAWFKKFTSPESPDRLSPDREKKYELFLSGFAFYAGEIRMRDVTSELLGGWLNQERERYGRKYRWSLARKRDAGQAIKRVYRWAFSKGWIPASDILEMEFTEPEPRDSLVSKEEHVKLILECQRMPRQRPFGLFLIALWHSGGRPIQVREVTAKHVINGDWVFRTHKTSKKTKRKLIVRVTPCLGTLTRILMHFRPKGNLFLNAHGTAWKKDSTVRRLQRMKERLGIESEFTLYSYRHTFTTDALLNDVPIPVVAALLNHSDVSMVSKVYSHLQKKDEAMQQAVRKVRG